MRENGKREKDQTLWKPFVLQCVWVSGDQNCWKTIGFIRFSGSESIANYRWTIAGAGGRSLGLPQYGSGKTIGFARFSGWESMETIGFVRILGLRRPELLENHWFYKVSRVGIYSELSANYLRIICELSRARAVAA